METTAPTSGQLHQHRAMSFINRWAKLKDYWHNDDRDELYDLKARKLIEWLASGEVVATGLIKRESSFFADVRSLIKTKGARLTSMIGDRDAVYDHPDYHHVSVLINLTDGEAITIPIDETERLKNESLNAELKRQYEIAKIEHKQAVKSWRSNGGTDNKLETLWLDCRDDVIDYLNKIGTAQSRQALIWCETTPTKKQIQRIRVICGDGFASTFSNLVAVAKIKPLEPAYPTYYPTETEIEVDVETYISGTIPVVDEALEYARNSILSTPDESAKSLADRCFEVEHYIHDLILADQIESLIDTCNRILNGKLKTAEAIYEELTWHDLDLSETLGLRTYTDHWGTTTHARFSKWHETNLDPEGLWLVEFQSQFDPTCIFHMPYREAIKRGVKVSELTVHKSDVSNYGRAITPEEQLLYPIELLLSIFDLDPSDFSYDLAKYKKPSRYQYDPGFYDHDDEYDDFILDELHSY